MTRQGSFEPDLDRWNAWTPVEVADRLRGVRATWYVLAGWAVDLFLGRQTRLHDDLEIGVPAQGFPAIRDALGDLELFVVGDGRAWPLTESALGSHFQTWGRERTTGVWRVDIVREPWDGDAWAYRRDPRIRLPRSRLIEQSVDGIPYVRPEVVLLFKAKATRSKDEADFAQALPRLDAARRLWLRGALELAHPGHHWLNEL